MTLSHDPKSTRSDSAGGQLPTDASIPEREPRSDHHGARRLQHNQLTDDFSCSQAIKKMADVGYYRTVTKLHDASSCKEGQQTQLIATQDFFLKMHIEELQPMVLGRLAELTHTVIPHHTCDDNSAHGSPADTVPF